MSHLVAESTADTDAVDDDELTEAVGTISRTARRHTDRAGTVPGVLDLCRADADRGRLTVVPGGADLFQWRAGRMIDPPNPDGSEPDRPAPTLQLVAATSEGGSTETTVAVGTSEPATTDASTAEEDEDSDHSNTISLLFR